MTEKNRSYKNIIFFGSYILIVFLIFSLHYNMSLDTGDDSIFKDILDNKTVFEHIKTLYFYTNGKVFPDTMAAIFTHLDPIIWKILNTIIFVIIIICIKAFYFEKSFGYLNIVDICLSSSVVLLYPFDLMHSAGYVATSTNYIWSFAALLIAILPIKFSAHFHRYKVMYLICIAGAIYAGNQEQAGAILLIVYLLYILYSIFSHKRIDKFIWIQFTISVTSLFVIFTAPGHIRRMEQYTRFNVPDFLELDIFDKLVRGFTSTVSYLFYKTNVIWPLFCFLLMLVVWSKYKSYLIKAISMLPFFCSLLTGVLRTRLLPLEWQQLFCWCPEWGYSMWDFHRITSETFLEIKYYIPILVSIIVMGIVILEIFWIYGIGKEGIVFFLTFSAGLCTRFVLGFSPTIYVSSFRTFSYLYFAIGICSVLLLKKLLYDCKKRYWITGSVVLAGLLFFSYATSLKSIR